MSKAEKLVTVDVCFECAECHARRPAIQVPPGAPMGGRFQTYLNCPLCSCSFIVVVPTVKDPSNDWPLEIVGSGPEGRDL